MVKRYHISRFVDDEARLIEAKQNIYGLLEKANQLSRDIVTHHGKSKKISGGVQCFV